MEEQMPEHEVVQWLLGEEAPSVRYLTLRDLLGLEDRDPVLVSAKKAIMETGPVPKILAAQDPGGYWGRPEDFYQCSKYKGTVWNVILLSQLEADGADPKVQNAVDFLLQWSRCGNGGFTHRGSPEGGRKCVLDCLTANLIFSMVHFGRLDDEKVQSSIGLIASEFEGVERHRLCVGCRSGIVKSLRALAEIPPTRRSGHVKDAIDTYAEIVLDRCLDLEGIEKRRMRPEWLAPNAPRMWNTDLLEILNVLAKLGVHDERMRVAIAHIASLQQPDGRWRMGKSFNARYLVPLEKDGKPSKWVTLQALVLFRRLPDDLLP
jgi:hypothetical protein